jgi:hypothetical protein
MANKPNTPGTDERDEYGTPRGSVKPGPSGTVGSEGGGTGMGRDRDLEDEESIDRNRPGQGSNKDKDIGSQGGRGMENPGTSSPGSGSQGNRNR